MKLGNKSRFGRKPCIACEDKSPFPSFDIPAKKIDEWTSILEVSKIKPSQRRKFTVCWRHFKAEVKNFNNWTIDIYHLPSKIFYDWK